MTQTQRGAIVSEAEAGIRLDKYLSDVFPEMSRAVWSRRIQDEQVLIDGQPSQPSYRLKVGDPITIIDRPQVQTKLNIPIVYEDDYVIVVDKPTGILTHSKGGLNDEATVASTLSSKIDDVDSARPGIVHRLDRDTSGVMIVAKTVDTRKYLQKQFQNRTVEKIYHCITAGVPKLPEGIIKFPIERNPKKPSTFRVGAQGKSAETHYKVLEATSDKALIELKPKTGRTHQLRVHMKALDCPILGDRLYGKSGDRLYLHASSLAISVAHNSAKVFKSDLPKEFSDVMAK